MSGKVKILVNGIPFEADMPSIVFGEPFEVGEDPNSIHVHIDDGVKKYEFLTYTTDLSALKLIFKNKTFRSSSLTSAKLNDQFEKQRVGVEKFAAGRFITCFSHADHEKIQMWSMYGDKAHPKNNVLLKFPNFAKSFNECFNTDYVLVDTGKMYCSGPEYINLVKRCTLPDPEPVPDGVDIITSVNDICIFDVEYLKPDSERFTKNYADKANVDFSKFGGDEIELDGYDPTELGRQKTDPWKDEEETRILSIFDKQEYNKHSYIDLRLKDEIFRNLTVILNPWEEDGFKESVDEIIKNADLPEDIKNSISVKSSAIKGTVSI